MPYKWGGSSLVNTDCSGTVNYVLNLMYDTHHRVCANDFYTMFFTKQVQSDKDITALFFIEKDTGRAVHIAGHLYGDFFLNASSIEEGQRAHIRKRTELEAMYPLFALQYRALDVSKWIDSAKTAIAKS